MMKLAMILTISGLSILTAPGQTYCSTMSMSDARNAEGCIAPMVTFREWRTFSMVYSYAPTSTATPTVERWETNATGNGQCGIFPLQNSCPPTFTYEGPSINGNVHQFRVVVINQINFPIPGIPVNICWPATASYQAQTSRPVVYCAQCP